MKGPSINRIKPTIKIGFLISIVLLWASCDKKEAIKTTEEKPEDKKIDTPASEPEHFSYHWDFEGSGFPTDLTREVPRDAHSIISDPTDPGNRVMRSIMAQGAYRSEVRINRFFDVGTDFWIGFRMMRPNSGHTGTVVNFQVGPFSTDGGISWNGLHQFSSNITDDRMQHKTFASIKGGQTIRIIEEYTGALGSGNWGHWEKWVIHCKFRDSEEGVLKIWRNDQLLVSKVARNGFEDTITMIKWGAYIGSNNQATAETVVYFDDVKIMGANGSYNDVAP